MNTVEPIRSMWDLKRVEKILIEKSKRDYVIFMVGINSGLRISDILGLNVGDVKNKSHIDIFEKKTNKRKYFPLNDKLQLILRQYTKDKDEDAPLFVTNHSNRMGRVTYYRIINQACKKAGLDCKIGTHSLRKTFGYHHYKKFKDIAILQKIFNHSSPDITLRYIGINQDLIDESYKKFIL